MENNIKTKNTVYFIIYGTFLCIIVLSMLFFSFLSPYEEAWGFETNQVDADSLLVLRFYWIVVSIANLLLSFVSKKHKKYFFVIFLILALLSIAKLVSLLLI